MDPHANDHVYVFDGDDFLRRKYLQLHQYLVDIIDCHLIGILMYLLHIHCGCNGCYMEVASQLTFLKQVEQEEKLTKNGIYKMNNVIEFKPKETVYVLKFTAIIKND